MAEKGTTTKRKYTKRMKPRTRYFRKNRFVDTLKEHHVINVLKKQFDRKWVDMYQNYTQVDRTSPGMLRLSYNGVGTAEIIRGFGVNQRIGDDINLRSLILRVNAFFNPSIVSPDPGHAMRITIFRWNQDLVQGIPSVSSIYEYASSGAGYYQNLTSPIQSQGSREHTFTVLYDRVFGLTPGSNNVVIQKKIELKDVKLSFVTNSDALGGSGHIFMCITGDDATGAHTPDIQLAFHSRLNYIG